MNENEVKKKKLKEIIGKFSVNTLFELSPDVFGDNEKYLGIGRFFIDIEDKSVFAPIQRLLDEYYFKITEENGKIVLVPLELKEVSK